jgi:Flp pilus assembly protein TadD
MPVLTVGVVNYVVDPLQIYRKQQWVEPRFWSNQRSQNAGKIRSYLAQDGYDSIILGNSVADNFRPSRVAEVMGWKKTMKLTIDGGQPSEQAFMLEQALKTGRVKNVFWCIRAANFMDNESEKWHSTEKMPFYLYTQNFLDDNEYILSLDTFKFSYESVRKKNNWTLDLDLLNYWQSKRHIIAQIEYNSEKVISKLQKAKPVCISDLQESERYPLIDNNIMKFAKLYEDTRFLIVLAPQARLSVATFGVKRVNEYLSVQSYLVNKFDKMKNVEVYGFDNEDYLVNNLANYRDPIHYHSGVNESLLRSIVSGACRLTKKNIKSYVSDVLNKICDYRLVSDFEAMVPLALPGENESLREAIMTEKFKNNVKEAKKLVKGGKQSDALFVLNQVFTTPGVNDECLADGYVLRAGIYSSRQQNERAVADYDQAIMHAPDKAESYIERGVVRLRMGDVEGARLDCLEFVRRKPKNYRGYRLLGNVEARAGNMEKALGHLSRAIELNPQKAVLYAERGKIHERIGNKSLAEDDFQKSKKYDSDAKITKEN